MLVRGVEVFLFQPVIASGCGASIVVQAPIVTDTSITLYDCELIDNIAVAPAGTNCFVVG